MLNIKQLGRQLARTDGAEIAEAAMVLPLAFMFMLGIIWFGRAFNIYSTITQAAQQGAIVAARSQACATCTNGDMYGTTTQVDSAVTNVLAASSIDISQIPVSPRPSNQLCSWPFTSAAPQNASGCATTSHNIWVCKRVLLNQPTSSQPQQCGSIVTFQYPYKFYLPFTSLNNQQVTLSAQAQSRMED